MTITRRDPIKKITLATAGICFFGSSFLQAKVYLTVEQAQKVLWGNGVLTPVQITLTKEQAKSIRKASKVRVNYRNITAWKTAEGGWFILDKVIGKHENIDVAVALTNEGKVKGIEILEYRESYGHEVANDKWLNQFKRKDNSKHLKLDRQIKNISGATLSCRNITDAINRLTHTWEQVLQYQ